MRPKYNGIKFYSQSNLSITWELEKAESILSSFNSNFIYEDINAVIELYNIQQLMNTGVKLNSWDDVQYEKHKNTSKSFSGIIGRFFSKITNDNFIEYTQKVCIDYFDDFWELVVKFKTYKRISEDIFLYYLRLPDSSLHEILKHKDLVDYYNVCLAEFMRTYHHTYKILVSKFLEDNNGLYFIPNDLKPTEFEEIFDKYIESDNVNANILMLIFNAQNTKECPISDKLRLKARRRFDKFWEDNADKALSINHGIEISIVDQDEIINYQFDGTNGHIAYDIKWLNDNLDYPTILNNFIYIFEMFDYQFRCSYVFVKSQMGAFEDIFRAKGVRFYPKSNHFNIKDLLSGLQMKVYYDFLQKNGIDIEDVFKWFFESYLPENFNAIGFSINSSSKGATYLEKIRNLASEMDGILKQFRMYVTNGEIDRELFEMSSEHVVIGSIPSIIPDKYAYPASNRINNEIAALFSDQSTLSYTKKTKSKYSTLFELIKNEEMMISDFERYQIPRIQWLIDNGCLIVNENNIIQLSLPKIRILKDAYENDVICYYSYRQIKHYLDEMVFDGDIRLSSTLFTEPEVDYLNYKLNKSVFSNGLDLRNKYLHSTYPRNEEQHIRDYMELLKIMVIIIVKINDEFCSGN